MCELEGRAWLMKGLGEGRQAWEDSTPGLGGNQAHHPGVSEVGRG